MNSERCLYCVKKLSDSKKYEIWNEGSCCSVECKSKAEKKLSKSFNFQLSKYYFLIIVFGVFLHIINNLTLNLKYFFEGLNIVWGLFVLILPFISKPIIPNIPIKKSTMITIICGVLLIILPIISIINKVFWI